MGTVNDGLQRIAKAVGEQAREYAPRDPNEWNAIEEATHAIVVPAISVHGFEAVLGVLFASKADPYVAAVIVELSGTGSVPGSRIFRVNELFSDDEIVTGALSYLEASPEAHLEDGGWAWTTLWNLWGQLEPVDHARLLAQLIERVPWNDRMLWMIGDGPLATLANDPANLETVASVEAIRGKVARARKLVEVDWPYGSADA